MKRKAKKEFVGRNRAFALIIMLLALAVYIFIGRHAVSMTSGAVVGWMLEQNKTERADALDALFLAELDWQDMLGLNISADFVSDNLLLAKRYYIGEKASYLLVDLEKEWNEEKRAYLNGLLNLSRNTKAYEIEKLNYKGVFDLTGAIHSRKERAYHILDLMAVTGEEIAKYGENNMTVQKSILSLDKAAKAFQDERYEEAESNIADANTELQEASTESQRVKKLLDLGKNFFVRYWWQIIFVLIMLSIATLIIANKIRVKLARSKLEGMKKELEALNSMIKKAQEDRFKAKTLTEKGYKLKVEGYLEKIAEIKHTIPVLESIILGNKKIIEKDKKKSAVLEVKR